MISEYTIKVLGDLGATWAVRGPAEGPNGKVRRGKWTIDGRPAKPHEVRKLNACSVARGFGACVVEAKPGAWQGSLARLEAHGEA
jgi:hypothetical protein